MVLPCGLISRHPASFGWWLAMSEITEQAMSDTVLPDKVTVNKIPRPLSDVLVVVRWNGGPRSLDLTFEPREDHYMRNVLARPSWLLRWAFKVAWHDFKLFVRHRPKRPIEVLADFKRRVVASDE
jgi:hypothetical protein